jgi:hypothetical protein
MALFYAGFAIRQLSNGRAIILLYRQQGYDMALALLISRHRS